MKYFLYLALLTSSVHAFSQLESVAVTIGQPFEHGFELLCKALEDKKVHAINVTNDALSINDVTSNQMVKSVLPHARYYINGYEVKHGQTRAIPFDSKKKCRIRMYARSQDFYLNGYQVVGLALAATGVIIDFEYTFDYDITDGISLAELLADRLTAWDAKTPNYSLSYRPPLYLHVTIKE